MVSICQRQRNFLSLIPVVVVISKMRLTVWLYGGTWQRLRMCTMSECIQKQFQLTDTRRRTTGHSRRQWRTISTIPTISTSWRNRGALRVGIFLAVTVASRSDAQNVPQSVRAGPTTEFPRLRSSWFSGVHWLYLGFLLGRVTSLALSTATQPFSDLS